MDDRVRAIADEHLSARSDDWRRLDDEHVTRDSAIEAIQAALATAEAASGAGERETGIRCLTCHSDVIATPGSMRCDCRLIPWSACLPPATDPAMVEANPIIGLIDPVLKQAEQSGNTAGLWLFASQWRTVRAALAAAPTIPATGEAVPKPLRVDWNKHDLAEAYDLVEGVRSKMAQSSESPLDTSLRAALNAIEAADCEWDGLTKATIPATGHAATEGEGA